MENTFWKQNKSTLRHVKRMKKGGHSPLNILPFFPPPFFPNYRFPTDRSSWNMLVSFTRTWPSGVGSSGRVKHQKTSHRTSHALHQGLLVIQWHKTEGPSTKYHHFIKVSIDQNEECKDSVRGKFFLISLKGYLWGFDGVFLKKAVLIFFLFVRKNSYKVVVFWK